MQDPSKKFKIIFSRLGIRLGRGRGSLPRSRFLDVTQRSPKRTFGGALRDIQKTAAKGTREGAFIGFTNHRVQSPEALYIHLKVDFHNGVILTCVRT